MSDMERSGPEDVEGHALRSQERDRDAATDDVAGHRAAQDAEAVDEDDVAGHRAAQDAEAVDEDDVAGHRAAQDAEAVDEDDVAGHHVS